MPFFCYKALRTDGKVIQQKIALPHIEALRTYLKQAELELLEYQIISPLYMTIYVSWRHWFFSKKKQLTFLIDFCFYLYQCLQAGLPLMQSLLSFQQALPQHSPFQPVLLHLMHLIAQGFSFSQGLKQYPHYFEALFIAMIEVGEKSGTLTTVMAQLHAMLCWHRDFFGHVQRRLLYPMFTMVVVLTLFVFLFIVVVPELVQFLTYLQIPLSFSTRAFLAFSKFIQEYGLWLCALGIVSYISLFLVYRLHQAGRYWLDKGLVHCWGIGALIEAHALMRFFRVLTMTYQAGIPLIEGLLLARNILSNSFLQQKAMTLSTLLEQGYPLSASFEQSHFIVPAHFAFIRMGEQTGQLEHAFSSIEAFYRAYIDTRTEILTKLLEPALTVILGMLLIWMIFAIFTPIYQHFSKMI